MIKASRTLEAGIGARESVKFRLVLDKEHALMLAKILEITKLSAADWLAHVLREELQGLGVAVPADSLDWEELLARHQEKDDESRQEEPTEQSGIAGPVQLPLPGA